jgi:hypothetical protein
MVGLLVPFANLLLAPALVAGGTLLVLALDPLGEDGTKPPPDPGGGEGGDGPEDEAASGPGGIPRD